MSLAEQLARCDAEIAEMELQRDAPAWLVTLGVTNWQIGKEFDSRADACAERGRRLRSCDAAGGALSIFAGFIGKPENIAAILAAISKLNTQNRSDNGRPRTN